MNHLKILSHDNSLIANDNIRSAILENEMTDVILNVKVLIFCSFSWEHFQSSVPEKRMQNISTLMILHLLGIVSVWAKSLSTSLKKLKLTDIGLL